MSLRLETGSSQLVYLGAGVLRSRNELFGTTLITEDLAENTMSVTKNFPTLISDAKLRSSVAVASNLVYEETF